MATAEIRIPVSAASYAAAIEGLVRINERILASGNFPPLYAAGVRYKREPRDVWRHAGDVLKSRWGDCEDLAAWRAAELRASGEDPRAFVAVYQSGPKRYHAIVGRGDGTTEDPSRRLGMQPGGKSPMATLEGDPMNANAEKVDRRRNARALARYCNKFMQRAPIGDRGAYLGLGDDPMPGEQRVTFDLYRSGRGWSGLVRVPLAVLRKGDTPQAIVARTTPTDPSQPGAKQATATKAIRLAAKISQLPGVSMLVPPGARAALAVLKSPIGQLATKGAGKILSRLF